MATQIRRHSTLEALRSDVRTTCAVAQSGKEVTCLPAQLAPYRTVPPSRAEFAFWSLAANAKTGTLYLISIQSRSKSLCAVTNTVPLPTEEVAHSPEHHLAGQTLTTLYTTHWTLYAKVYTHCAKTRPCAPTPRCRRGWSRIEHSGRRWPESRCTPRATTGGPRRNSFGHGQILGSLCVCGVRETTHYRGRGPADKILTPTCRRYVGDLAISLTFSP
jgi:hypothetical protein